MNRGQTNFDDQTLIIKLFGILKGGHSVMFIALIDCSFSFSYEKSHSMVLTLKMYQ